MLSDFGLEPTTATSVCVGDLFGRLVVKAVGKVPGAYRYIAVCECGCGSALTPARFDHLHKGTTKSCGCLQREVSSTHGISSSPHYDRWRMMMDRCYSPKNSAYPDYGGRGIKVCERWHDAETFVKELPNGYFLGAEMDRIDNDGNYEPGNIRWVTRQRNTGNRRSAHCLTYNGRTKSITEWAKEVGINSGTLWTRINEFDWSVEDALTAPARPKARLLTWNGKTQSVSEWARDIGIPIQTLLNRVQSGWSDEEAITAKRYAQPKPRESARKYEFDGGWRTLREIAEKTGISQKLLRKRINERGWSIEKATADRKDYAVSTEP